MKFQQLTKNGCKNGDRLTAQAPDSSFEEPKVKRGNAPMENKTAENVVASLGDEEEIMRIRLRYQQALRAGMNVADATAYANDPNSGPGSGQGKLSAGSAIVQGCGAAQSGPGER